MSNNCPTNHAIMFFFILSLLLAHNHDFFSSPSRPTKTRPRDSSCSCTCPTRIPTATAATSPTIPAVDVAVADATLTVLLAFLSGALFTLLCILTIRFPTLFTAPLRYAVFMAVGFSCSCLRCIKRLHSPPPPPPSPAGHHHSPRKVGGGVSASLLNTLPIFVYCAERRPKLGKGAGACAICLSEFLNEQTLRWLPDCDHLFHQGCIDTWLEFHKTCPCCRANVERVGGEILLLENGVNSRPETGLFRRLPGRDGGHYLDAGRRIGCLLRVLMGRRRHHSHSPRHR